MRAPISAVRWREDLISKAESLADNPHPRAKKFSCDIRQFLFRKRRSQFSILFTIAEERVVILSIRHHSRRPLEDGDLGLENGHLTEHGINPSLRRNRVGQPLLRFSPDF